MNRHIFENHANLEYENIKKKYEKEQPEIDATIIKSHIRLFQVLEIYKLKEMKATLHLVPIVTGKDQIVAFNKWAEKKRESVQLFFFFFYSRCNVVKKE